MSGRIYRCFVVKGEDVCSYRLRRSSKSIGSEENRRTKGPSEGGDYMLRSE